MIYFQVRRFWANFNEFGQFSRSSAIFWVKRAKSWLFLLRFLRQGKKWSGVLGVKPLLVLSVYFTDNHKNRFEKWKFKTAGLQNRKDGTRTHPAFFFITLTLWLWHYCQPTSAILSDLLTCFRVSDKKSANCHFVSHHFNKYFIFFSPNKQWLCLPSGHCVSATNKFHIVNLSKL